MYSTPSKQTIGDYILGIAGNALGGGMPTPESIRTTAAETLAMNKIRSFAQKIGAGNMSSQNTRQTAAGAVMTTKYTPAANVPIRKRKALKPSEKKFKNKVVKAIEGNLGSQYVVNVWPSALLTWTAWSPSGATNGGQTTFLIPHCGGNSSVDREIMLVRPFDEYVLADRAEHKYNLRSSSTDIVLVNDQTSAGGGTDRTVDIDIYEYVAKQDVYESTAWATEYNADYAQIDPPTNTSSRTYRELGPTGLANTPFENSSWNQRFLMTGKKKLLLGPGDSSHVAYQYKHNKVVNYNDAQENLALKGISRCYILVVNNVDRTATADGRGLLVYVSQKMNYNINNLKKFTGYAPVP